MKLALPFAAGFFIGEMFEPLVIALLRATDEFLRGGRKAGRLGLLLRRHGLGHNERHGDVKEQSGAPENRQEHERQGG